MTSPLRHVVRAFGYCAALLPLSVAAFGALITGRPGRAVGWWSRLAGGPASRPVPARAVLGHALLSGPLGLAGLILLFVEMLVVLRGALFGLVVDGPYDGSWGGPSLAGAWLAHFLVAVPVAVVATLGLVGIAAVHRRLTAGLLGEGRPRWLIPVALCVPLPALVFFAAWTQQV